MKRVLGGVLLAFTVSAASAADISVVPFDGDKNIIAIRLTGHIEPSDGPRFVKKFWSAIRKRHGVLLELNSGGGDTTTSQDIARFIRKQGIATLVRGDCTSGCGIIALSARELFVAADGRVGLHQAWREDENGNAVGDLPVTRNIAVFLRPAGVPESALTRMLTAGPYDMAFLSDDELEAMGAHVNRNVLRASQ